MIRNFLTRVPFKQYNAMLGACAPPMRSAIASSATPIQQGSFHSSANQQALPEESPWEMLRHIANATKPAMYDNITSNAKISEEFKEALANVRSQQGITDNDLLDGIGQTHTFRENSKDKSIDDLLQAYPIGRSGSVPIGSKLSTLFFLGDAQKLPSFQKHIKQWVNSDSDAQLDTSAKKGCIGYLMTYQKEIVIVDKSHYTGVNEGVYFKKDDDTIRYVFDFDKKQEAGFEKGLLKIANTYFDESEYPQWPSQARAVSQNQGVNSR